MKVKTPVADSSKRQRKKKQFFKAKEKSPKTCNVKCVALMGRNMTAKFYFPFPANAKLTYFNNINLLSRSAGESGI
jgi:hypothetical protein